MAEFRVNSRMCEHDFALIKSNGNEMTTENLTSKDETN